MRARPVEALALATLISFPALYAGLVKQQLALDSMLLRFALALVLAIAAIEVLGTVVAAYRSHNERVARRTDAADVVAGELSAREVKELDSAVTH